MSDYRQLLAKANKAGTWEAISYNELIDIAEGLEEEIEDEKLRRASFIDRLNTWLRQEMPHPAPQAEMGSELKGFLDLLVFSMQMRLCWKHSG